MDECIKPVGYQAGPCCNYYYYATTIIILILILGMIMGRMERKMASGKIDLRIM